MEPDSLYALHLRDTEGLLPTEIICGQASVTRIDVLTAANGDGETICFAVKSRGNMVYVDTEDVWAFQYDPPTALPQ